MFDGFDARGSASCFAASLPLQNSAFLDQEIGYNKEPRGYTCYSPRTVLREGIAHCMEGRLAGRAGATATRASGAAGRSRSRARFRSRAGGLSRERPLGRRRQVRLRRPASREPVYATIRELAMSYFEHYYNPAGEKTLRAYSRPVNLARFDRGIRWAETLEEVWAIRNICARFPHQILTRYGA